MKNIGIIIGSVRENRKGLKIGKWVLNELKDTDNNFKIVDLREFNLVHYNEPGSPRSSKDYKYDATKEWSKTISKFDSFIFVTPEYNGYFTGAMKDAIDYLYHEWVGKNYLVVGYGSRGAKRATDQLINLLNSFSMVNTGIIAISKPWDSLQDDGTILSDYIEGNIIELVNTL